jgi:hypothetical protein
VVLVAKDYCYLLVVLVAMNYHYLLVVLVAKDYYYLLVVLVAMNCHYLLVVLVAKDYCYLLVVLVAMNCHYLLVVLVAKDYCYLLVVLNLVVNMFVVHNLVADHNFAVVHNLVADHNFAVDHIAVVAAMNLHTMDHQMQKYIVAIVRRTPEYKYDIIKCDKCESILPIHLHIVQTWHVDTRNVNSPDCMVQVHSIHHLVVIHTHCTQSILRIVHVCVIYTIIVSLLRTLYAPTLCS